jgi:hypothetical protein
MCAFHDPRLLETTAFKFNSKLKMLLKAQDEVCKVIYTPPNLKDLKDSIRTKVDKTQGWTALERSRENDTWRNRSRVVHHQSILWYGKIKFQRGTYVHRAIVVGLGQSELASCEDALLKMQPFDRQKFIRNLTWTKFKFCGAHYVRLHAWFDTQKLASCLEGAKSYHNGSTTLTGRGQP